MNERMRDSEMADLERLVRIVAEDDRRVQVPAHLEAAVMQTWDSITPLAVQRRPFRSIRTALLATGSIAAAIVTAIAIYNAPSAPSRPEPVAAPSSAEIILVPDPMFDASAASIVRVRMPRAALATLGIPMAEPHEGGLVDLEIVVGEDGFARTIRRATTVAVQRE
jgi:hypothetical protein